MILERQKFIDNMAEHINDDVDPKVGIIWYDITNNKLFGVIKYNYDDEELKPSKGLITCPELHKYIWKRKTVPIRSYLKQICTKRKKQKKTHKPIEA